MITGLVGSSGRWNGYDILGKLRGEAMLSSQSNALSSPLLSPPNNNPLNPLLILLPLSPRLFHPHINTPDPLPFIP
jgi:hypothetical protein